MVSSVNELLRALDANPALLEAARARILTRELMELPQAVGRMTMTLERLVLSHERLAMSHEELAASHRELAASHERLAASHNRLAAGQDELRETLREFMAATDARFDKVDEQLAEAREERAELRETLRKFMASTDARFNEAAAERDELRASTDARFAEAKSEREELRMTLREFMASTAEQFAESRKRQNTLTQDVGVLKGWHMEYLFERSLDFYVFTLGYELVETTSMLDRAKMMREHGDALDIPEGDRESFAVADAVAKVRDADGRELYLAIEVSFTVHWQDTSRAIRNAEYIRRITGLPARAAVAGRQISERTQATIDEEDEEVLFIAMRR